MKYSYGVKKTYNSFAFYSASIGFASIFILPNFGMDPFGIPKMLILAIVAFCFVPVAIRKFVSEKEEVKFLYKGSLFAMIAMISWLILSFLTSEIPKTQQFYGVWGRNTGLLTSICLILILIQSFLLVQGGNVATLLKSLFIFSTLSAIYGLIQFLGLEPIKYKNGYSPLIGFFGNPNFQSSFLGLGVLSSIWFAAFQVSAKHLKIPLLLIPILELFLIYKSGSIQGVFVFLISVVIVIALYTIEKVQKRSKAVVASIFVIISIFGTLGLFGVGPIARFFDGASIEFRRIYWRIGMRMIQENLIFGVGLDGYGDYFRRFRTQGDEKLLTGTVTNAAHNVFIDFGVSAGLPFLILYLVLVLLASFLIFRSQLINSTVIEVKVLFGLFIAFQYQMLISINQLGLAIWGFALLGALLGISIKTVLNEKLNFSKQQYRLRRNSKMPMAVLIFGLLGTVIAMPPLLADYKFRNSLFEGDGKKIFAVGLNKPLDINRLINTGDLMRDNGFTEEAKQIAQTAIRFNPDSFYSWLFLLSIPDITPIERVIAEENARRLDPLWFPK